MSALDRANQLAFLAAAAEKRIQKKENQYESTVARVSKLLRDALTKRADIADAGDTTQDKMLRAFNVGLQLNQLAGREEQIEAVGQVRVESFLVRVTVWLPEVDPSVPTDRILRATKFLASLACVSVLEAVGSKTATSSKSGLWTRSDIHTLTATDVLDNQSTLYTEMGFQFSMRLSGGVTGQGDIHPRDSDADGVGKNVKNTPNQNVFQKLTTNRAVEGLMVEVLQGMLTALGQMTWRFAGRQPIRAVENFANVVRNEVRIRNDGTWKFEDRLGDVADTGQTAPEVVAGRPGSKRQAKKIADKFAAAKKKAAEASKDPDALRKLLELGPLLPDPDDVF